MGVPVFLRSRDRLTDLQAMMHYLERASGIGDIVILDHASSYQPLLDWLRTLRSRPHVRVLRTPNMPGESAAFPLIADIWRSDYPHADHAVISDPDVVPWAGCPKDFVTHAIHALDLYPEYRCAGIALDISSLPSVYPWWMNVCRAEIPFWCRPRTSGWFQAAIGGTLAVYCRDRSLFTTHPHGMDALRSNWPYVARHTTWHLDMARLPPDEQHYMAEMDTDWNASHRGYNDARDRPPPWTPRAWMTEEETDWCTRALHWLGAL